MYPKATKLHKKIYVEPEGEETSSLVMSSSNLVFALWPSSIATPLVNKNTAHSLRLRHLTPSIARRRLDQDIHPRNPGSRNPWLLIGLRKDY